MAKWDIKLKHKIAAIKTLECETHPQNLINKVLMLRDIESIVSHQSAMKVHCSSQDACGIAVSKWFSECILLSFIIALFFGFSLSK